MNDSRIEKLRDLMTAAVELKRLAGGFCEAFAVKKTWFLAEDYEDSFVDGEPVGNVWFCPRPSTMQNYIRQGDLTAVTEKLTVHMTVIFPISSNSEEAIGRHVQLTEELIDTVRKVACSNDYGFVKAEPAHDDWGTPYLFVNMERRNFFTSIEFQFLTAIQ
ncbi:MAG: hypothetical protein Q4D62_12435 [Planctomycetia bacterium]|nr:hypothetical protein [Planctomycetia bacterium]